MTVVGIAGCSALMLTGFGMYDSIRDIVGLQFGELYHYDLTTVLQEELSDRQRGYRSVPVLTMMRSISRYMFIRSPWR